MKRTHLVILIVGLVLLVDQATKFWVKTTLAYEEEFELLGIPGLLVHFIENPGMAFGIELGGAYGKVALSLFRVLAVGFLLYLIRELIRARASRGLLACFALVLAGAVGNIIDSAFYGLIFSASGTHTPATLFPEGGGYAPFLYGRVVDMLYFPLFDGHFPDWLPVWGGEYFLFFRPVFNVADAAISVGVVCLIAFYSSFFRHEPTPEEPASHEVPVVPASEAPAHPSTAASPE